jgi:hypothetical protein
MSVVCVVCCQVEVSVTSWSLVQRSPTDCVCVCVWFTNLYKEEAMTRVGPQDQRPNKIQFAQKVKTELCHSNSVRPFVSCCIKRNIFVMPVLRLKFICVGLWAGLTPIFLPPHDSLMTVEYQWNDNWHSNTEVLGDKPVPVPICPPQIPLGRKWDWSRASAVWDRRVTAWAMGRPAFKVTQHNTSKHYYRTMRWTLTEWRQNDLAVLGALCVPFSTIHDATQSMGWRGC